MIWSEVPGRNATCLNSYPLLDLPLYIRFRGSLDHVAVLFPETVLQAFNLLTQWVERCCKSIAMGPYLPFQLVHLRKTSTISLTRQGWDVTVLFYGLFVLGRWKIR